MGSKNRSIRFKIFMLLLLPLLSLSALWGFAMNLTVGDGLALLRTSTLYNTIGVPSMDLGVQLQTERTLASSLISSGGGVSTEMSAQRGRTDVALRKFTASATGEEASGAITPGLAAPLAALLRELDRLDEIRADIDSRASDRLAAVQAYNRILDSLFAVYDQISLVPDMSVYKQAVAMQAMGNARELLSRENALIAGALIQGRLTSAERVAFSDWVSTRRHLYERQLPALGPELRRMYEQVLNSAPYEQFVHLEEELVSSARTGASLPPADQWRPLVDSLMSTIDRTNADAANLLNAESTSVATGILLRIALAGGLGLIAVIASIVISLRFARRHVRDLAVLRNSALELADERLPRVVERLRHGADVDVNAEAPPIQAGGSIEVADVGHAFSSVQRTAVEAAVGQAKLRRGISQMFVNLARRNQTLLNRQLQLLDSMQRRTTDPDGLEDLFRLDSLTTRMRRHAESLIILSGSTPGRAWRKPVPVVDLIRAAVAEVEDYTRVQVLPVGDTAVTGASAADLIHLLAELVDNAATFSPPQTTVQVRGEQVANGFVIEIEDRGLGLSAEEYGAINDSLANPPEFDLADSDRLGLFVVGQLAARYGVNVTLRPSPYGGTTAIVLIPRALISAEGGPAAIEARQTGENTYTARHMAPSADEAVTTFRATVEEPADDAATTAAFAATTASPARARDRSPDDTPAGTQVGTQAGTQAGDQADAPADKDAPGADRPTKQPTKEPAKERTGTDTSPFFTPAALRTEPVPSSVVRHDDDDEPVRQGPSLTVVPNPTANPTAKAAAPDAPTPPTGAPATGPSPAQPGRKPVTNGTYAGLPRRVRQASLAPQLRNKPAPLSAPTPGPVPERSPDEARALFSAFQQGVRRGRLDSEGQPGGRDPDDDLANKITAEKGTE
ncbi:nitrate- and nitrite sensing domain-containing protein [Thermopolyspora sp. NPDC052614]|uniref:nitrate- and nitrite sensing domain-containing protein n=1 Tax=Thermopolyspora sp. NPDC052614 TaxID=3155682 RepID=UPI003444C35D